MTVALPPGADVPATEDMREIGARARDLGVRVELVLGSVGPADDWAASSPRSARASSTGPA